MPSSCNNIRNTYVRRIFPIESIYNCFFRNNNSKTANFKLSRQTSAMREKSQQLTALCNCEIFLIYVSLHVNFLSSYFDDHSIIEGRKFLNIIRSTIVYDCCAIFTWGKTTCVEFTLANKIKRRDCEFRSSSARWCTRTSTGSETMKLALRRACQLSPPPFLSIRSALAW